MGKQLIETPKVASAATEFELPNEKTTSPEVVKTEIKKKGKEGNNPTNDGRGTKKFKNLKPKYRNRSTSITMQCISRR